MTLQEIFIFNLKNWRSKRKFSQAYLAELSGMSHSFIAQIEAGKRNPSFETIELISGALSVSPWQLFYSPEAMPENAEDRKIQKDSEDIGELVKYMEKDMILRIKEMFHQYKTKK